LGVAGGLGAAFLTLLRVIYSIAISGATLKKMAEEHRTRLDQKLARDRLIANLEPLWHQLCDDVEATCTKLRSVYGLNPVVQIDDQSWVIRISHADPSAGDAERATEFALELRLEKKLKRLVARVTKRDSRGRDLQAGAEEPRSYKVVADHFNDSLQFFDGQALRPIEVAEEEIVERLLHMNLDA